MPKGSCLKLFAMGAAFAAFMPLSEVAIATPNQAGMNAGGAWARDFNPSNAFRSATSSLGLEDTKTSGELGGEVGLQVKQKQQRNFRCRDGARLTAGGIRVFIEECEQSDSGELDRISVSVCDALTQGIRCSEDRYTVTREIPLGGEAAFSGGNLYGAYRVEAECSSSSCTMTMHQLHGDAWGGNDMRQQGNDRVNQDPSHPSNTIADVRDNPTFDQGSQYAEDRSKCLGAQINQLFSQGDIPVSCDPDDPRTIDFLDIEGGEQCEPDEITSEKCEVDIPTNVVTCEPNSRNCKVERRTEEHVCSMEREVSVVGSELECKNMYFKCAPSAGSCCNIRITCNNNGTATLKHNDCCGDTYTFNANDVNYLTGSGQQYAYHSASRIICEATGNCVVNYQAHKCSNKNNKTGYYPNYNRITLTTKNIYEDKWVDSCGPLEERRPVTD
ncbi:MULTISPECIES: hypothetical protein [Halomonadaceae]|jgi:hypothetical protein|uniref:hypothetical protein n=1 Tax=Halomonadaceae TaxID=28256 RepID=UPI00022D357A|nr:hypothetical protein [Halomonas sp. HAL1]EHA16205.1 hypothetical protein HAL1_07545 [Halomonas sp. HAL1]WKV95141.1 hypothetical protein Q3Y66_20840 [Halomonas sp. HAL1]